MKPYLTDYVVDAQAESDRTVIRAGFIPYKAQIVWGEPLVLTMVVANVGEADFEFMFGGHGRHDHIKITMTDANGNPLPDPHANPRMPPTLRPSEIVTPGGSNFIQPIDLTKFRTITEPGQYSVTCSFSFDDEQANLKGVAKPVIKSRFSFTILPRTPERVSSILDELLGKVATVQESQLPEAIAEIARFGKDHAVPRLDSLTKAGTKSRRIAAFAALPLVPGDAALSVALVGLSDADPAIRIAAYSALGRMPLARSIHELLKGLTRETSPVQEAVLLAMGTSKSSLVLPVISSHA